MSVYSVRRIGLVEGLRGSSPRATDFKRVFGAAVGDHAERGHTRRAHCFAEVGHDRDLGWPDNRGAHDRSSPTVEVDGLRAPECDTRVGREHDDHRETVVLRAQDGLVGRPGSALVRVTGELHLEDHHPGGQLGPLGGKLDDEVRSVHRGLDLAVALVSGGWTRRSPIRRWCASRPRSRGARLRATRGAVRASAEEGSARVGLGEERAGEGGGGGVVNYEETATGPTRSACFQSTAVAILRLTSCCRGRTVTRPAQTASAAEWLIPTGALSSSTAPACVPFVLRQ